MIRTGAVALMFLLSRHVAEAQEVLPKWISEKGYWVVESNLKSPRNHLIRFYNNDHLLIYQEELNGMKLNVRRRKVRMKLKQALDTALIAWEHKTDPARQAALVKSRF